MSEVNISATAVKELREQTGVGMMDCKKALVEATRLRIGALSLSATARCKSARASAFRPSNASV